MSSMFSRGFARRAMSTSAKAGEEEAAQAGAGLAVAMGTTFMTYMAADFLSNFIQHPTQKVRAGGEEDDGDHVRTPYAFDRFDCAH